MTSPGTAAADSPVCATAAVDRNSIGTGMAETLSKVRISKIPSLVASGCGGEYSPFADRRSPIVNQALQPMRRHVQRRVVHRVLFSARGFFALHLEDVVDLIFDVQKLCLGEGVSD